MDRKLLMEKFNKQPRLGPRATAEDKGKVNNAVFSALQMVNQETVMMASGDNRFHANPQVNPQAAFIFFEPAETPYKWQGARV